MVMHYWKGKQMRTYAGYNTTVYKHSRWYKFPPHLTCFLFDPLCLYWSCSTWLVTLRRDKLRGSNPDAGKRDQTWSTYKRCFPESTYTHKINGTVCGDKSISYILMRAYFTTSRTMKSRKSCIKCIFVVPPCSTTWSRMNDIMPDIIEQCRFIFRKQAKRTNTDNGHRMRLWRLCFQSTVILVVIDGWSMIHCQTND